MRTETEKDSLLARPAIEYDNRTVQRLLSNSEKHPKVDSIIVDLIASRAPKRLRAGVLRCILEQCPVISTPAVAEATKHRYSYAARAEYAALARLASRAIEDEHQSSRRGV